MTEIIYADAVSNIYLRAGVVRLELSVMDEAPKADETVRMRASHHVVLPLDAFLQAVRMQEAVIKKLIDDGVLKKREEVSAVLNP